MRFAHALFNKCLFLIFKNGSKKGYIEISENFYLELLFFVLGVSISHYYYLCYYYHYHYCYYYYYYYYFHYYCCYYYFWHCYCHYYFFVFNAFNFYFSSFYLSILSFWHGQTLFNVSNKDTETISVSLMNTLSSVCMIYSSNDLLLKWHY